MGITSRSASPGPSCVAAESKESLAASQASLPSFSFRISPFQSLENQLGEEALVVVIKSKIWGEY